MNFSQKPRFTPEQEVLLWAMRVDPSDDPRIAGILGPGFNWSSLWERAILYGMIPLLYKRLKGGMAHLVPPGELTRLRGLFTENSINNLRKMQHLFQAIEILADSGIESMAFKGPILAVQAYRDLSMRSFGDLDILIHARDIQPVHTILINHGYVLKDLHPTSVKRLFTVMVHKDLQFVFQNTLLELHWEIIERLYASNLDMDAIWERALPLTISGRTVKSISPEDMVIVLCFHGFKHKWQNPRWLADLVHLISNNPAIKWHDVVVRAEALGLKRIVLIGLFLARNYGGAGFAFDDLPPPDATTEKLAGEIQLNLFQDPTLELSYADAFFYIKARERIRDKLLFLLYFFANEILNFPHWTMQQISHIKTRFGNHER
jgi:hypothetical protein